MESWWCVEHLLVSMLHVCGTERAFSSTAVSEDISSLESRMRQELIAVQVRCDRLAREVQRIGACAVPESTVGVSICDQGLFLSIFRRRGRS